VADNVFYVFREVWIEDRGFAGFFFVADFISSLL